MTVRIGHIGLGIMGRRMLNAVAAHPEIVSQRIWDLDPDVTAMAAGLVPDAFAVDSAVEVIEADDVDVVYIASPPVTHLDYVEQVLAAGKPIYCEKPLAVDLNRAAKVVARVEAAGTVNAINFPFGQAPHVQTLKRRLENGDAGDADRIEMRFHFNSWPRGWQMDAASWLDGTIEGGFTREVVSHFIYLTLRLVGTMKVERSEVSFPAGRSENRLQATLSANGIPIYIQGAVGGRAPDYNEWTYYGSKSSFRIYDWGGLQVGSDQGWQELPPDKAPKGAANETLTALVSQIQGRQAYLPTLAEGLAVQQVVEQLLAN